MVDRGVNAVWPVPQVPQIRRVRLNARYVKHAVTNVHQRGFDGWIHRQPVNGRRAGLDPGSFWLTRSDLLHLLRESFDVTVTWEETEFVNGPRIEVPCER